jgi:D-lactate dehydrogenase
MKVTIYEAFREERDAISRHLNKRIKPVFFAGTIQEKGDKLPPSEFISVRTQSRLPKSFKNIKALLTRSQGYDHVLNFCQESGFTGKAGHLGNYCARAVAEHAIMFMLMLMRKSLKQLRQFDSFDRDGLTGTDCYRKNACVIGVGHIGGAIVEMLNGLRMNVKGVDPVRRLKNLEYTTLKKAVAWADVVFCAALLTEQTRAMLDFKALSASRRRLFLINVARGEITPARDLERLLDKGILKGLALDVYEEEPSLAGTLRSGKGRLTERHKTLLRLRKRDSVIMTPHNAFNSQEALEEKARRTARSIEIFMRSGRFPYPVRWPQTV